LSFAPFCCFLPARRPGRPRSNQVVDQSGRPIQGLKVTQEWAYFRVDLAASVDVRRPDQQGYVIFPYRTTWASLASRILGGIGYASEPYGPSVFILACDENHLQQGKLFGDGNKFWNHRDVKASRIFTKPVKECSLM
jgi:hypothetical protein